MKITSREKSRDGRMIRIFLDDRYAFSIPAGAYMANHLYEKEELTEEQVAHIKQNVLVQSARERAVNLLMARDRSQYEIKTRLMKIGYDEDIAKKVVEDLKTIGYIDDSRLFSNMLRIGLEPKPCQKKL